MAVPNLSAHVVSARRRSIIWLGVRASSPPTDPAHGACGFTGTRRAGARGSGAWGCGPAMLAGRPSRWRPAEVTAIDPEPEMLRIAEAEFGGCRDRISFMRGSSDDLSPALGRFRLVTMGRSFPSMDRVETLRRLDEMIAPRGAVVLFDSGPS